MGWIERDEKGCRLAAARRYARAPRTVLSAEFLSGLAISGDLAYVTRGKGSETELLRVDLNSGKTAHITSLPAPAAEMVVGEDRLCWREHRPAGLPGVPFVTAGAPVNVIRTCPAKGGKAAMVAQVSADTTLLGIADGSVYWVERHGIEGSPGAVTVIRRASLPGGKAETVLVEQRWRSVALADGALVWTTSSVEAAEPDQFSSVKRRPLDQGEVTTIGDWVAPRAAVLPSSRGLYVQDSYRLWRLGGRRCDQRALHEVPPAFSAGVIAAGEEYVVLGPSGHRRIAAIPLTTWGKLRRSLQP